MSPFKTISVWLMIAVWLSSCCFAPATRRHSPLMGKQVPGSLIKVSVGEAQAPALLLIQQPRLTGTRPVGSAMDGFSVVISRGLFELSLLADLPSDAPGLAPLALAQNWQFLLRAAPFPRSPSLA